MEVFKFDTYKDYLRYKLGPQGLGRGGKSILAQYLPCQSGFISQILNGDAQFSLEHSIRIAKFLSLPPKEEEFFMLLVHLEKAGSQELREFYQEQIKEKRKEQKAIKSRIKVEDGLPVEDQNRYYSSWVYAAIHIATLIPDLKTPKEISDRLRLEVNLVNEVISFLEKSMIVKRVSGELRPGKARIHLDNSSTLINQHHINWRTEAIKKIQIETEKDRLSNIHYSSVLAMSKKDAERIKEIILESLSRCEEVLRPSREEDLFIMNLDFFRL